jgi:quercetin dioxygenase-like cupin family protein
VNSKVFNVNDIPWELTDDNNQTKLLVGPEICPNSKLRLVKLKAKSRVDVHEHDFVQTLYFLNGKAGCITIEDEKHQIEAGLVVIVKRGACHGIHNNSDDDLIILVYEEIDHTEKTELPYVDL